MAKLEGGPPCQEPACPSQAKHRGLCDVHYHRLLYGACRFCERPSNNSEGHCDSHRDRASVSRFLTRAVLLMRNRVRAKRGRNALYYRHLPVAPLSSILGAFLHDETLNRLWNAWVNSNFSLSLRPVPDRIDSEEGYTPQNIEWVTFSENARRACWKRIEG